MHFNLMESNQKVKSLLSNWKKRSEATNIWNLLRQQKIQGWKSFVRKIKRKEFQKHSAEIEIEGQYYQLTVAKIEHDSNEGTVYFFAAPNITHIILREKELKEKSDLLNKSKQELEKFSYIASHDLKTPVRNVVRFLDLLERKIVKYNDKDLKEYTYQARQSASQMYHLIQDVQEFVLPESIQNNNTAVDLNEMLMGICMDLQPHMVKKNAELRISTMPTITAEKKHMSQLFGNLIENGLKYNKSRRPRVTVSHRIDADRHVFAIADNGIGFDEKFSKQILQLFNRLHTSIDYQGGGVGLSVCKQIIDMYQGEIWMETKPKEGSVFFFTLSMN